MIVGLLSFELRRLLRSLPNAIVLMIVAWYMTPLRRAVLEYLDVPRIVEIPYCYCIEGFQREEEPDQRAEIDLVPSFHAYNKGVWIVRESDGQETRVWYSTEEQLYNYLMSLGPGVCYLTSLSPGCMLGHYVGEPTGLAPCEMATAIPEGKSTPVIDILMCEHPYFPTTDLTANPPTPTPSQ